MNTRLCQDTLWFSPDVKQWFNENHTQIASMQGEISATE